MIILGVSVLLDCSFLGSRAGENGILFRSFSIYTPGHFWIVVVFLTPNMGYMS